MSRRNRSSRPVNYNRKTGSMGRWDNRVRDEIIARAEIDAIHAQMRKNSFLAHALRSEADPMFHVIISAKASATYRAKSRKPTLPHVKFLDNEPGE